METKSELDMQLSDLNKYMKDFPDLNGSIADIELKRDEIIIKAKEILGDNYAMCEKGITEHLEKRILIAVNKKES